MTTALNSCIYTGALRHRRFSPTEHNFSYSVFMFYLDTREIDQLLKLNPLCSEKWWAPIRFKRSDFHIDQESQNADSLPSLDDSIRKTIYLKTGRHFTGNIKFLVNLRIWGINFNPLSTYYCFDETTNHLKYILSEVNNTPWNQRHAYLLNMESSDQAQKKQFYCEFKKDFHVSPFNPMNMVYRWHSNLPQKKLSIHLENWSEINDKKIMDATLVLKQERLDSSAIYKIIWRFPWMTLKVIAAIYWQAVKLCWKKVPIFDHPESHTTRINEQGYSSLKIKD